ncbi:Twitchin [Trichinella britovi]|uniref:non-specific serine/threonine protein kinase n=1 Tax=Trichinella britovi TaxID=45882 RepID=A0A0V1CPA6_TRIBR|nr:Twitchin [Trichinella britovi]
MPGGKAPRFTQKPVIKQTPEGHLLMECLLDSQPNPKVQWFHGSKPVTDNARYTLNSKHLGKEQHLVTLLIKDPTADDRGTYKCNVANEFGDSNANINLNFAAEEESKIKPPVFLTKPKIIPKNDGAIILMECRVKSAVLPTATWIHNGAPVQAGGRVKITAVKEPDHTYLFELELHDLVPEDSGLYKCTVKNDAGETNANLTLNFDIPPEPADFSPTIAEKPSITTSADGTVVSLKCVAKAKPKPKATWSLDGVPLKESAKLVHHEETVGPNLYLFRLDIMNPTEKSAGIYKCSLKNKLGETSANVNLKIDAEELKQKLERKPIFLPRIEPTVDADRIFIECKFQSDTSPKAIWKKDNKILSQSEQITKKLTSNGKGQYTASLSVKNPTDRDSGKYELFLENSAGKTETSFPIVVPEMKRLKATSPSPVPKKKSSAKPPMFTNELHNESVEEGATAILAVTLECDTSTKLIWSRNGLQISTGGNFETFFDGSAGRLTIKNVKKQFGGTYVCTAESRFGNAKSSCRLTVESKSKCSFLIIIFCETLTNDSIPTIEMQMDDDQSQAKTSIATDYSEDEMTESISELPSVSMKPPQISRRHTEADAELFAQPHVGRGARRSSLRPGEIAEETFRRSSNAREPSNEKHGHRRSSDWSYLERRASSVEITSESVQELLEKPTGPLMPLPENTPAAPKITEIPENVTVLEGETALVSCSVQGNPVPTFRWMKAGREVLPGGRYKHLTHTDNNTVTLVIGKAKLEDEDAYDLIAENEHGTDQATIKVFVTNAAGVDFRSLLKHRQYEKWGKHKHKGDSGDLKPGDDQQRRASMLPDKKPSFWEIEIQDQRVQQTVHKEAKFECKFCRPKAKIRWYKQKQEIFTGMKYKIINDKEFCTLIINNPDQDDASKYTCVANGIPTTAMLYVEDPPTKFTFEKPLPTSTELIRTREGILECRVSHPDAPVKWYKGDDELKPSSKYSMEIDRFGRCVLIIANVDYDDMGEYTAKINKDNVTSCCVAVGNPRCEFISPMKSQKVQEKENASLECELNDKAAEVTWYHDESKITIDKVKFEEVRIGRKRKLIIKNCGVEDEGVYKCMTSDDQTMGQLIVEPLNKFLEKLTDKTVVEKDDVTLQCQTKDTHGAATWFKNGKQITPMPGGKFETKSKNGTHTLLIRKCELTDDDKYEVEVGGLKGECSVSVLEAEKKPIFTGKPQKIEAEAGKPITVSIPYMVKGTRKADPVATVSHNGTALKLKSGDQIKVTVTADSVEIEFKDPKMADDGKWDITLSNSAGSTTTNFQMEVRDRPGPPEGPLEIADLKATECKVKWRPPKDTGNSPIHHYLVEMLDGTTGEWKKLGQSKACEMKVPNLIKGQNYKFNIVAVNKIGVSDPLIGGEFIAKDPDCKPTLDKVALKNLKVKVGEVIKYKIDIGGEPPPTAIWLFGDQPVKQNVRAKVVTTAKETELTVSDAERGDSGKYTLRVKNSLGEETGVGLVIVVSKPAKPTGPLVVSEVNKEGCKVAWNAPEDDGGEPIEEFIVEAQESGKGGDFFEVARCGPAEKEAVIKGLKNKGKYNFRVKAKNKEGVSDALVTKEATLIKDPWDEPGKPGKPEITDSDKDYVTLSWTPPTSDGGAPIEKYVVECKEKNSKDWKPVGESAKTTATINQGLKEGNEYQFRVIAVNKAGPGEPSQPSSIHVMKPKFSMKKLFIDVVFTFIYYEKNFNTAAPWIDLNSMGNLVIKAGQEAKFSPKIGGQPPPKVTWTKVGSGQINEGSRIHFKDSKPGIAVLTILKAVRGDCGDYMINVKNQKGEQSATASLTVLDRPTPPKGPLKVTDVFENEMTLHWQMPEDDGGVPVEAYEVEKFDVDHGRWIPCGRTNEEKITVHNLVPGHSYLFRVKAINKEGESDALALTDPVLAKNPYDPPTKMEKPNVTDWDSDHVDLEWKPPENDGGAEIEKYIIEKKRKNDKWVPALEVSPDKLEARIGDLTKDEQYQFRIIAVNKAGPSEPSEPSNRVIAKPRFLAPLINREDLPMTTVKVGQLIKFNVRIIGEPPPEVFWEKDGKKLSSSAELTIENPDYLSKFFINKSARKHAGIYKITAQNSSGVDVAEVTISVLGKPSKPKGPLEVKDVFADHMTLSWNAPEDDGGTPIECYEIEKCDPATGIWIPCGRTADTNFVADGLLEGNSYEFRVKAVNSEGESEPLQTDTSIKAKNPYSYEPNPDKPNKPEVVDWDIDHVDLAWSPPQNDGGAPIEEYVIEKRTKYGRWEPAASVPGDATSVTISDLTPNDEYEFRIKAKNKGGFSDPSDPSEAVITKHRNLPPKIDRSAMQPVTVKAGQVIRFDVPVEGEPPPTMTWFHEGEIMKQKGNIKIENGDYNTKFAIRLAERSDSGVYTLKAVNVNGEDEATVKVEVTDKPSAPEGPLEAKEVYGDHITLGWKAPEDDGGIPISHYVVEMLDPQLGHWVVAGKTPTGDSTEYTVENLIPGHDYKFRVKAQNANGESDALETTKPITAKNPYDEPGKPGQPQVMDWDENFIEIGWTPPESDGGAPIESYIVEIKEKFSPFWSKAGETPADVTAFKVTDLTPGNEYQLRVRAKNKAGPGEPSDETERVVTKARRVPPKFNKEIIQDIRLKAGQHYRLEIPLIGEPAPQLSYAFNNSPIDVSDRLKFEQREHDVLFVIKRALRTDTGFYLITAKNEYGEDTARLNVTVLDHPSKISDLKVSDIHKDGCKISWQAPEDDGGSEISHYVIEKEDIANGRWVTAAETPSCEADISGLHPNHEYRIRVKAVNRNGESEPVVCDESFIARDPFEEPDKMLPPVVLDWDKDHVQLELIKPESDGGAPIEKYVVEMKCNNGEWMPAVEVPADQNLVTVPDLKEGQKYQFRVKAVNKAGSGQPSDPSKTVTAKPRHLPPKIDRSTLHSVKIKAGQKLEFDVNVEGEPPPQIRWLLNGESLGSSERTRVVNKDYNTTLRTVDVKRFDSGVYKIIAENESGTDEAEVMVTILDAPTAPRGPLQVSDVHSEGCNLAWKPPEDNGGSDILNYVIEKQEDGGRWVECGTSYDTEFKVGKLKPGEEYNFRVKAVNRQGESKPLTTSTSIVAKNPYDTPDKPENLKVIDWDKDHMDLQWQPPVNDGGAPIEKYLVEVKSRLDDWKPAVEVTADTCKATVPGLTPRESYQFRVRAVNKAGPGKPSEETAPMIAKPRRLAPKLKLDDLFDIRIKAGQPLSMVVPFEAEPQPLIIWMHEDIKLESNDRTEIEHAENLTSVEIPRSVRSDTGPYTIILQNEYGEDKGVVNVTVLDVPLAPEGPLKVKDVTKQSCNLSWKPPNDNGGSEIIHYVVEKMDTSRGTWQEVGEFPDCEAKVNRLIPGKEYKFRVKAVNSLGESKPLTTEASIIAKDPFDVPSPPEELTVVDWDRDFVALQWKPPENDGGSPVSEYIIDVREKGNPFWCEAGRTGGNKPSFCVKNLKEGAAYEFRVTAVNDAGPSNPCDTVCAAAKPRRLSPKILTTIRLIKVRAGMPLRMPVDFIGEPAPDVSWTKEKASLNERIQIENTEGKTELFISSAKRCDTGPYNLRLTNEYGQDQGEFQFLIQDVPGVPEGPLEAVEITKDSVVLSWKPPLDDGGSEVTNYVVEKRDTHSDVWNLVSSFVPGTTVKALKLTEGHSYEFRVMAENAFGRSEPLNTIRPITAKDPFAPPDKPGAPVVKAHDRDFIAIEWQKPLDDGGSPITHYDIERRHNKTGRWIKINQDPVKSLKFQDNRVNEGHLYEYRVVAVNEAGSSEPSDPSSAVYAKPMFEVPKFLLDLNGKEVRIKAGEPLDLNIPFTGSPTPTIEWIKDNISVPESSLNTDDQHTQLYIAHSKRSDSGDYKIMAKNQSGTAEALVKVVVIDKPSEPRGPFNYTGISKHSIKLEWNPPDDDGGSEIIGYAMEIQEFGSPVWEKIRDYIPSTSYTVKGLDEGRQYLFRVRAENMIGLGEPLHSVPMTAKPSYDVPGAPSAPEVTGYDNTYISLKWNPPRSDGGSPITEYIVEKHEKKGGGDWSPCYTSHSTSCECVVKNLVPGESYQFRVRAVNLAGEGPPSRFSEPCTCQPFIHPPGPPDSPRVGKVTKRSVDLTWNRPLKDGGSAITGYMIEKKPFVSNEWIPCNTQPILGTEFTVTGLPEGEQFMFRVIAVNKAGPGEPSKPTENIIIQDELGKPYIDIGSVKDVTVRAGEPYTIQIPYTGGNPKPTVSFLNNDNEIFDEENRVKITVTDGCAILENLCSKRSDTGPYKVSLSNRYGKDSCKFKVKVLDRPSPPVGPLEATNVDADAITLHWLPPKDDGGEEIRNYIVEKKEPNSDEWKTVNASVMGTSFRVRNLKEGNQYEFRVRAENQYGISDPLTTMEPVVAKSQHQPPSAPGIPEACGTSEDFINLTWTKPFYDGGQPITGYIVEKREKGEENWIRADFGMFPDTKAKITSVIPNKCYEFRVCAVNSVGAGPFSQTSLPIYAQYPPSAPKIDISLLTRDIYTVVGSPLSINVSYSAVPNGTVTWTKGSEILLSNDHLNVEQNENIAVVSTKSCVRSDSGIYTVVVQNSLGSDSATIRVTVFDRPSPPLGPIIHSDITPESCVLSWLSPKDDGGSPVTNYVIEKCTTDQPDNWERVSSFVRGLRYEVIGLVPKASYKFRIRAQNEYGTSDPLESDLPIVTKYQFDVPSPPGTPEAVDMDTTWVTLTWDRPNSDGGSKILGYLVEFREPDSYKWTSANAFLAKEPRLVIESLRDQSEYQFRVLAKNAAGFSKPSEPSSFIKLKPKFSPPGAPSLPYTDRIGRNYVTLMWEPPLLDGGSKITGYIVERREVGSYSWIRCNDYNIRDPEFTVPDLVEFKDYEFRVSAVNSAGRGAPSPVATVKVQESGGFKPEFVRKLFNTVVPLNRKAVFECEAIGKPTPVVRWIRHGRDISDCGRYKVEEFETKYTLTIEEVWDIDNGEFACEATNQFGSDVTVAVLKIQEPPVIDKEPGNQTYSEEELARIKIFFHGDPEFSCFLNQNGREISADDDFVKLVAFDDHVLITLNSVRKQDAGRYEFTVQNESGKATCVFYVYVTGLPGPPIGPLLITDITQHSAVLQWKPPREDGGTKILYYLVEKRDLAREEWTTVANSVKELSVQALGLFEKHEYSFRVSAVNENGQGPPLDADEPITAKFPFDPPLAPGIPDIISVTSDYLSLSWDRPKRDGGDTVAGYVIEKKEEGTELWQRCNAVPIPQTVFNVPNLIDGRKYLFRVFAVNAAGMSPPAECASPVTFSPNSSAKAPEIVTPLRNVSGEEGRSVRLECEITGDPAPEIRWFKGARDITNGGKHSIFSIGNKHVLVINDLFGEDADEYSCRALNIAGCRSTTGEVFIKSAPKILLPPHYQARVEFRKGETVSLKIPFRGYPQPTAVWTKQGSRCCSEGRFSIETVDRLATLNISNSSKEDSGTYELRVENELGFDVSSVEIRICDRPDPPQCPAVETILDNAVILSWKPPVDDGGSDISNYLIEKRQLPNSDWMPCVKSRYCYVTVEGLKSQQTYEFRVSAENKFGLSDSSEPTSPVIIEAPDTKQGKNKKLNDINAKISAAQISPLNYDNYGIELLFFGLLDCVIANLQCVLVFDISKEYAPQPVSIKNQDVEKYYDILEEIGTGAFGVVHRCVEKSTGNVFAAKFVNTSSPAEKEMVRKEIEIMSELRHPNLIHLHDAFDNDNSIVMIYEFLSGGELFEKVSDEENRMTEDEAIGYMRQVCEGLAHMHERNIVHLDIKPENVMFCSKNSNVLKLIDFGLAAKLNPSDIVKVTTGTAEFAAPEIVDMEPIGFYTDMWAVGVLAYVLLSGLSPFGGETDVETLKNVKNCDWDFDSDAFKTVSDEAKDFIKKLLVRDPNCRLTVQQCLEHPWLKKQLEKSDFVKDRIPSDRYVKYRDSIRQKYVDWPEPNPPLGRIAQYSSLKKLQPKKYNIKDTFFDRHEAQPRFVIKPYSTSCVEGQSASFFCRIIASAPPVVAWCRDNVELKQSVKYMKKYHANDYTLTINRVRQEDRGEYVVKAKNAYGAKEEVVFLNVYKLPEAKKPSIANEEKRSVMTTSMTSDFPIWEEAGEPPKFTFHLRTRLIQLNHSCKLICCVSGKPNPTIEWTKNGHEVDSHRVSITNKHGVCSLEIYGVTEEDAGKYTCTATNSNGQDTTSCYLNVQGRTARNDHNNNNKTSKSLFNSSRYYPPSRYGYSENRLNANVDILKSRSEAHILKSDLSNRVQDDIADRMAVDDSVLALNETPRFTSLLHNVYVQADETAIFQCSVDGLPDPDVRWLRNGEEIFPVKDKYEISRIGNEVTLKVFHTNETDQAEYCCEAKNTAGYQVTKSMLINAQPHPNTNGIVAENNCENL